MRFTTVGESNQQINGLKPFCLGHCVNMSGVPDSKALVGFNAESALYLTESSWGRS